MRVGLSAGLETASQFNDEADAVEQLHDPFMI